MKYLSILFLIVLSLSLISCTTTKQPIQNTSTLPDSFTINFSGDFTSSGGSRYFQASLTFKDNQLISAWQLYKSQPGTGGEYITECVLDMKSLIWMDKTSGEECKYKGVIVPLAKEEISQKIDSGEFSPKGSCPHLGICYEILQQ